MDTLVRHKSFTFRTATEWAGGKAAILASSDKPLVRVSSPPEFRGEPDVWTPEDMLVASVDTCLLMTFLTIADKRELGIEAYYSEACGLLQFVEGHYRFTRIVVKPTIVITDEAEADDVLRAIKDAHADCLIANSLLAGVVVVEPEITTRDAA